MTINPLDLHREAFVADLHCDTVLLMRRGYDISKRNDNGHVDIPRLIDGGVNLQMFACCVDSSPPIDGCVEETESMIDRLTSGIADNNDRILLCRSHGDVVESDASGKIAALMSIENGLAIANDLDNLRRYYDQGVRSMTLVHAGSHDWCTSCFDKSPAFDGLSPFGLDVVRTMNELGMIIDVSHVSERAFYRTLEVSSAPVIASHSCASAVCNSPRNLTDDQLKALAERGGMAGINFCADFLSMECQAVSNEFYDKQFGDMMQASSLYLSRLSLEEYNRQIKPYQPMLDDWSAKLDPVAPSVSTVVDHIDHIVGLVGVDHVGLGSDYDGISKTPHRLEDCSKLPSITIELAKRGYEDDAIRKILGGNFMRVLAEVCP
jgi:membrane dipeptidase